MEHQVCQPKKRKMCLMRLIWVTRVCQKLTCFSILRNRKMLQKYPQRKRTLPRTISRRQTWKGSTPNCSRSSGSLCFPAWQVKWPALALHFWIHSHFLEEGMADHMLVSCEVAGQKTNCSNLFTRVPTDSGMCCALNSENTLRNSEYKELVESMQGSPAGSKMPSLGGEKSGLRLTLDLHSNKVSFGTLD